MSSPAYTSTTRPLDALAAGIVVVLCLSWGFNQVATKLAIHDIPPLTQAAVRSTVAALLISAWCRLRGIPLLKHDGTLWFGLLAGILFAAEFILIFQGLLYTTASRATLFIYLAPFFVVLGARILLPADRFSIAQWLGLALSFCGMVVAFGIPAPATDPKQLTGDIMMVGAALFWAATTLTIKASPLTRSIRRESDALSARRVGAGYGSGGDSRRGKCYAHAVGIGAGGVGLPDDLGRECDIRYLVRAYCPILGEPALGVHFSHATVRRGCRAPSARRSVNACVCGSRGAGCGRVAAG